jgi:hypothetical protein
MLSSSNSKELTLPSSSQMVRPALPNRASFLDPNRHCLPLWRIPNSVRVNIRAYISFRSFLLNFIASPVDDLSV